MTDKLYLLGRLRASITMASRAAESAARLAHFELAGRYSVAAASMTDDPLCLTRAIGAGPSSFHQAEQGLRPAPDR